MGTPDRRVLGDKLTCLSLLGDGDAISAGSHHSCGNAKGSDKPAPFSQHQDKTWARTGLPYPKHISDEGTATVLSYPFWPTLSICLSCDISMKLVSAKVLASSISVRCDEANAHRPNCRSQRAPRDQEREWFIWWNPFGRSLKWSFYRFTPCLGDVFVGRHIHRKACGFKNLSKRFQDLSMISGNTMSWWTTFDIRSEIFGGSGGFRTLRSDPYHPLQIAWCS